MTHDPRDVAHVAAVILSATGLVETHHIKAAVDAARNVLAEAYRRADEDEAAADAARTSAAASESEKVDGGTATKTE